MRVLLTVPALQTSRGDGRDDLRLLLDGNLLAELSRQWLPCEGCPLWRKYDFTEDICVLPSRNKVNGPGKILSGVRYLQ